MPKLEFFYDCSSPWTYLAFAGIRPMAAELGIDIEWRPILVGGVFNAVNPDLYAAREKIFQNKPRIEQMMIDLGEWAEYRDIRINWPSFHLQVNSVKMMRGCLVALENDIGEAFSERLFRGYWSDHQDVSGADILADIAAELGMSRDKFLMELDSEAIKLKLRENTEEVISRGGYGSPTMFIDTDHMYFGNDRLPLIEHRLRQLL
ncbi:2-hydroxychromene-2-carboxylate isomerase [Halieaceae bacterium IMCC14734]|uniref:2-hydroxychromene-2-carboxylate isomerase n=1 Tax=Candidatus Litorirhabdus singularis TaxID=2518993 RepID=A0ABT3TFU7_9GAMM|nr:2-hydroxychromene-2-carboxylate isomerase [Candidatus Litorirhabdus singularis]MCX2981090.1 2-hydroxychromene-2-carboxylate isomerase [Candidatus Litorirhabdus singularis]